MGRNRLIAVGACYIDTILSVPHYPSEDSKLRATNLTTRRGGNCPNTLEVLSQLVHSSASDLDLHLISVLPAAASQATRFIQDSLNPDTTSSANIDVSHCIHRDNAEAASSYIIQSVSTASRTIVNYNGLREMTATEFEEAFEGIIAAADGDAGDGRGDDLTWVHFEGRIPEVTRECVEWLRSRPAEGDAVSKIVVSIECEKPDREGLQELACLADVVFYSRTWSEGAGRAYRDAPTSLQEQASLVKHSQRGARPWLGLCTWGADGVAALALAGKPGGSESRAAASAKKIVVQDSVGAGDSFTVGILFGLLCREGWKTICEREPGEKSSEIAAADTHVWSLQRVLEFGNEVAATKLVREGFAGIGEGLAILLSCAH